MFRNSSPVGENDDEGGDISLQHGISCDNTKTSKSQPILHTLIVGSTAIGNENDCCPKTSPLADNDEGCDDNSLQDVITCDNTKLLESFLMEIRTKYKIPHQSFHDDDVPPVKYDEKGNAIHPIKRGKRQKYNYLYLYVIHDAVKVGVTSFKTFQDLIERHQTNLGKPIILIWFPVPYYTEPLFTREMFEEHFITIVSENAIAIIA